MTITFTNIGFSKMVSEKNFISIPFLSSICKGYGIKFQMVQHGVKQILLLY